MEECDIMMLHFQVKECIKSAALSCDVTVEMSHPVPTTHPLNSNRILARLYQKYAEHMGKYITQTVSSLIDIGALYDWHLRRILTIGINDECAFCKRW